MGIKLRTYGGANETLIELSDGSEVLFSYNTAVAGFKVGTGYFKIERFHSTTTSRHVNKYIGSSTPKVVEQAEVDASMSLMHKGD